MKVLFAVSNEEITESIVKKYQKEYKQIISYKNVYYFNAILKELQKDKTYDRVVISEDLEAFTHTQYDQIDKFIFDKLDTISDEASNVRGNDIPIILICSDRREKSEQMLVKLFGIGIYNAIIGNDRSIDEVCKLINRPRIKKEAKSYYKIDIDDVNYQAENENDVSEMEIQNIVAHYKRLGKNEEKFVESFDNIAAQYNDTQLRIISKFLPLNVRAVLEERSSKYQQIMSFNNTVSDSLRKAKEDKDEGPSEIFLKSKNKEGGLSKPVVIPSAVNMSGSKKLARQKQTVEPEPVEDYSTQKLDFNDFEDIEDIEQIEDVEVKTEDTLPEIQEEVESMVQEPMQPVKRGRGRPRKNPPVTETTEQVQQAKRGRGRPRKNPLPTQQEDFILPGFEEEPEQEPEENFLPGFDTDLQEPEVSKTYEPVQEKQELDTFLPGFEEEEPKQEEIKQPMYNNYNTNMHGVNNNITKQQNYEQQIDLSRLLTPDKKIATFVGTSKNGTSFIVNNVAELLSSMGINTAILDTTKNRNSYYIYTKNEESLRQIATQSIEGLAQGTARGISVNKNLTVYTSLPGEDEAISNVDKILETLLQKHSLILIDTDFNTPYGYFKQSQETYLVQSMDILTMQPLTAFLKELKMKNILDEKKLRIVLNKAVKIRGIRDEVIIGGMAFYNDPAMSFMTELFDRDKIKYVSIPFETETYVRYLEGVIECEISLNGYSKMFLQTLKELGNMVYPVVTQMSRNNQNYQPPSAQTNGGGNFSSSMNSTLDKMRGY